MVEAPPLVDFRVYDDVLPDPAAYRVRALAQPAGPVLGFSGIASPPDDWLERWIRASHPTYQPTLTCLRYMPRYQVEPNFIHNDVDMGQWTAVLYLTPHPPLDDGTHFWFHRRTWRYESIESLTGVAGLDVLAWDIWCTVPAQFNRLVLFPSSWFHSRALRDNYGEGDTARLIQVCFGTIGAD